MFIIENKGFGASGALKQDSKSGIWTSVEPVFSSQSTGVPFLEIQGLNFNAYFPTVAGFYEFCTNHIQ